MFGRLKSIKYSQTSSSCECECVCVCVCERVRHTETILVLGRGGGAVWFPEPSPCPEESCSVCSSPLEKDKSFLRSSSHGRVLTTVHRHRCPSWAPGGGGAGGRRMVSITFTLDWAEPDVLCNEMMKPCWFLCVCVCVCVCVCSLWDVLQPQNEEQNKRKKYDAKDVSSNHLQPALLRPFSKRTQRIKFEIKCHKNFYFYSENTQEWQTLVHDRGGDSA